MYSHKTVLVGRDHTLGETLDQIAEQLKNHGIRVLRLPEGSREEHCQIPMHQVDHYLSGTDILVISSRTRIDANILQLAPELKGIVFPSIGFNSCDIQAAAAHKVAVVNGVTPENYESIAEATIMLMSALLLELQQKRQWLKECQANPIASQYTSRMLKGKVIGLIGYGRIAQEVIKRLSTWGVEKFLVYTRSQPDSAPDSVQFCELPMLLKKSHIVSIHCPLNEQTQHMIGTRELDSMRSDAVLVNTSRGGIINELSLHQALQNKTIAAAAIDTFEQEPLAPDSLLRRLDNIYLTQHNIGHTRELFESLVPKAVDNVLTLLSGKQPEHWVNEHLFVQKPLPDS